MTDIEKLQSQLQLIRKAAGWTAEDLANMIGVTKQTISNLETQKSKMSKTQYLAIQMVISQKIATTPDDPTLASVMKVVMMPDEKQPINYDAVPQALKIVEEDKKQPVNNEDIPTDIKATNGNSSVSEYTNATHNPIAGAVVGTAAGSIASAMGLLGLAPAGAVAAAILGATIAPWLKKALDED